MDERSRTFYATPAPMTALPFDTCAKFLEDLPTDSVGAAPVVRGVLIHRDWAPLLGLKFSARRQADQHLRPVREVVRRIVELVPGPLTTERPVADRMVGICRHFAAIHVALLRNAGVPARLRFGFAQYFKDGWSDHQITEWWDGARWVRADPQVGPLAANVLDLTFDPIDLPAGQFLTAPEAWQRCRAGADDPKRFGIFDLRGLEYISGSITQDLAALNKIEMLPWDDWGWRRDDATNDALAELMVDDDLATLRDRFTEPDAAVSPTIATFVDGQVVPVDLDGALLAVP